MQGDGFSFRQNDLNRRRIRRFKLRHTCVQTDNASALRPSFGIIRQTTGCIPFMNHSNPIGTTYGA